MDFILLRIITGILFTLVGIRFFNGKAGHLTDMENYPLWVISIRVPGLIGKIIGIVCILIGALSLAIFIDLPR